MSQQDKNKWNQRYAEDSHRKNNPVTLLEDWLPKAPVGKALDVACGAGRNALFMAQAGFEVDAIDISREGLQRGRRDAESEGLTINWIEHDLDEAFDFDRDYNLIVVLWFVNLDLVTRLCGCLAVGGYLICEEHLITDEAVIGPKNAQFRVATGALRQAVSELDILYYEEGVTKSSETDSVASARVVAQKL